MRPKQGRDLAAGLREAEDVVDEQQRVGAGRVAEVLGHGQRREGDAETRARRLVHLAEDHAGLVDDALARCRRSWPPAFRARGRSPRGSARRRRRRPSSRRAGVAMRAISSVRMTVLPSPAPPNSPALPPRTNGVSRSITLMPVSKISVLVDRSCQRRGRRGGWASAPRRRPGRGRRPARRCRLNTRPSVALPTGTRDRAAGVDALLAADQAVGAAQGDAADAAAAEVLLHLAGEVDLDALCARTRPSRRCRSAGRRSSGNSASNVEPMTWVMWPTLFAVAVDIDWLVVGRLLFSSVASCPLRNAGVACASPLSTDHGPLTTHN